MPLSKTRIPAISFFTCLFLLAQQATYAGISKPQIPSTRISADSIPPNCPKSPEIEKIINDAISLGAPIYNEGLHMACYRIYEWAAYKILYEYGKSCKEVEKILKTAIEKSHGDYSDTEKAWLMRVAFDLIMGVPTKTGQPEKPDAPRKG